LLTLPHADYDLAVWHERRGVVTESFVPSGCRLVTANELLSKLHSGYLAQQRYQRRQHTLRVFLALGTSPRVEPPEGYGFPPSFASSADLMVGYLMLDCLIGNQDRHDENWGLIVCPGIPARITLAPTYPIFVTWLQYSVEDQNVMVYKERVLALHLLLLSRV
jgi:hypothetical protein